MKQQISEGTAFEDATEVLESLFLTWRRLTPDTTLSRTAAATLGTLYRVGPMRLTALAEAEAATQPAMTGLIGRLESHGLVNRTPDPSDGRAVLIGITPAGEAVVEQRRQKYAAAIANVLRQLPEPDFQHLVDALPALRRIATDTHPNQNPEDRR